MFKDDWYYSYLSVIILVGKCGVAKLNEKHATKERHQKSDYEWIQHKNAHFFYNIFFIFFGFFKYNPLTITRRWYRGFGTPMIFPRHKRWWVSLTKLWLNDFILWFSERTFLIYLRRSFFAAWYFYIFSILLDNIFGISMNKKDACYIITLQSWK